MLKLPQLFPFFKVSQFEDKADKEMKLFSEA